MTMPFRSRSFRTRIAVLSALVSGVVLLAFGLWTWGAAQRTSLRRLDQNIRDLAQRQLAVPMPPEYWQWAHEPFEFVLGDLRDNPFILLVRNRAGEVVDRTENWPTGLRAESFPTPAQAGFAEAPEPWTPPFEEWRGRGRMWMDPRNPRAAPPRNEGPPPPPGPPGPRLPLLSIVSQPFFTFEADGHAWRVGAMSNPDVTLILGLNLAPYAAEMGRLRMLFLMAVPAALFLIGMGGWWVAERALRPLETLTRAAEGITAQGLDRRIPVGREDAEFERLIRVFNGMIDRLEKSFQQAVRFSADAAHELKTPLTILQGELAEAVQAAEPGSPQQESLGGLLEEVRRLKAITRKLLLLSLADSGQLKPQTQPVSLSEVVEEAAEDARILAPDLEIREDVESEVWIEADPDLFRQVIQNLFANAVKYNAPRGVVAVELRRASDRVRFAIANAGPGIPPEDRERVFERFYRVDKARNRRVDGVGLGLSLAREIVRAHHGDLALEKSRESWTSFALTMPAIAPPEPIV